MGDNAARTSTEDLVPVNSGEIDPAADPDNSTTDVESKEKKMPYPTSVFFIVGNEFCERFSYYGMKAVLTLYMTKVLNFDDDFATVIYHAFSMFAYFTPLFGAMIADSALGKFRTIFYLSIVYCAGNVVLSLAATPPINLPAVPFSMIGLALIAIGTGGIKPCVAAFGGDQFKLPEQEVQLASFFSVFYFSINSGSLLSTILTPIFREDVKCFDQDNCFSLAFSVPAALMIVALIIFLVGRPMYTIRKPSGNIVIKLVKCIVHAISNKGKMGEKEHWLDHAEGPLYNKRFIEDVKIVLRVLLLYIPLPFFWALFDQQGSRWTLQATRMDGLVGGYTIKPDQVQVLNPALILIFIPLFDQVIYPLLAKCHILTNPLARLTVGGVLAGVAFVASGIVELELEKTYPTVLGSNEANLHIVNTLPCSVNVNVGNYPMKEILPYESFIFETIESRKDASFYTFKVQRDISSFECRNIAQQYSTNLYNVIEAKTILIGARSDSEGIGEENPIEIVFPTSADDRVKPKEGFPKLKFVLQGEIFDDIYKKDPDFYIRIASEGPTEFIFELEKIENGFVSQTADDIEPLEYFVFLEVEGFGSIQIKPQEFQLGGSYVVTISQNHNRVYNPDVIKEAYMYDVGVYTIVEPSSMHMFWLLPQYVIITMGEIMFSVTGLEFSYSQSPVSMKSVLQASWLLTVAFGNLIVVIVAEAKFFDEQSKEFFLFAGLMFADMVIFAIMAWRYIPAQLEDPSAQKEIEDKPKNKTNHDD